MANYGMTSRSEGPLFDKRIPPRTRVTDPQTSRDAERELRDSGQLGQQCRETLRQLCYFIAAHGYTPTSAELAGDNIKLRYMFARRLPDLEKTGHVTKGAARRCKISGRPSSTWSPA